MSETKKVYGNKELLGMRYVGSWVSPQLHAEITALAKSDGRSISKFIEMTLQKTVDEYKEQPK